MQQKKEMEDKKKKVCIVCQVSSDEMPILNFEYKGETHYICSQHIPVLIHKAKALEELLPGMKNTDPS